MSDGIDVPGEAANGRDDAAAQSTRHAGEPHNPAAETSYSSGQSGGSDADLGDGGIGPLLGQPASTAPSYRRSLFRR